MKFTFNWLKEFVDLKGPPHKAAHALTMAGLEVESLHRLPGENGRPQDWVLELAVTPNRGDCLGILGIAREVAALTGGSLKPLRVSPAGRSAGSDGFPDVRILSPGLCPRYSGRMVLDVRVAPSPVWMRERLEACGIRSINNVVDITNYVMLETGQPLHAFDADRLRGGRVVVRQAGETRRFVTLDEVERELAPEDLLICDGDGPVALAGVMGGKESEVRPETRRVFLESAHFDPRSVRRTAKRLGIRSEASHRFERGVDPEGTLHALDRAVLLLSEIAGGTPLKGFVDRYPRRIKPAPIWLRYQKVKGMLGVDLGRRRTERILRSLRLEIQGRSHKGIKVIPPSSRGDLAREADLIEELARLYGYENIPSTLPLVRSEGTGMDRRLSLERKARGFLMGEGLFEAVNLPFASAQMNQRFHGLWDDGGSPVAILNPLVQENAQMRMSLIPGLLETLRANLAQKAKGVLCFELSKAFRLDARALPEEKQHLAALLYGQRERKGLRGGESPLTFLDMKGLLEGLLELFRIERHAVWTEGAGLTFLHPGKSARLRFGGSPVGYLGEIHPDLRDELALPPVLIFELDFERMLQYPAPELTIRSLPRFPSVERDLAIVVDDEFPAQRIISWIKGLNQPLIEDVEVFDQYRGPPIPESKKSLAYRISYRADNRTLTDPEVNALHQELVSRIVEVFGAQPRT